MSDHKESYTLFYPHRPWSSCSFCLSNPCNLWSRSPSMHNPDCRTMAILFRSSQRPPQMCSLSSSSWPLLKHSLHRLWLLLENIFFPDLSSPSQDAGFLLSPETKLFCFLLEKERLECDGKIFLRFRRPWKMPPWLIDKGKIHLVKVQEQHTGLMWFLVSFLIIFIFLFPSWCTLSFLLVSNLYRISCWCALASIWVEISVQSTLCMLGKY